MTAGSVARFRRALAHLFRERQIYHRSDGVVHFVSMSPRTQIAMAILAFLGVSWVAYSSVNVVFKEQIIVAKDRKYNETVTNLQGRIAYNQRAYDELNYLNHVIKDEFDAAMRELGGRHRALESVLQEKSRLDQQIDNLSAAMAKTGAPGGQIQKNRNRIMIDSVGLDPTMRRSRAAKLKQSSMARKLKTAALSFSGLGAPAEELRADEYIRAAASRLRADQNDLLMRLEEDVQHKVDDMQAILASTGIEPEIVIANLKERSDPRVARGGPLIGLADAEGLVFEGASLDKIDNQDFFRNSHRISSHLDRMRELGQALQSVPLAMPLMTRYRLSSQFGARSDPFTGQRSFHPGMDFGADWKSPVLASAPGVVSFVGTRTGYGRTVEIDHGNGFKTRYAHLHKITVKRGQKVALQDKIGLVGSTGRATGPHLHYEIHFNGKLRNPMRFLEAGRYVFES